MTNYQKGRYYEYKTKGILAKRGYIVMRTAGSRGVFDLIALERQSGWLRFIQVKVNKMPSKKEIKEIRGFPNPFLSQKEVWFWKDKERRPQIFYYQKERLKNA